MKRIKNIPFISMHLACVGVFFVYPTPLAIGICAFLYFLRMFGITAGLPPLLLAPLLQDQPGGSVRPGLDGLQCDAEGPALVGPAPSRAPPYSDTPEDPHSPLGARLLVVAHRLDPPMSSKRTWPMVQRLGPLYPELRWLDRNHWVPGVRPGRICLLIDGWSGLVWGFFLSTVLLYHAHLHGQLDVPSLRQAPLRDDRREPEQLWVALITLGEGWHNNHHHYQSSANQGFFWWEIDITYYIIKAMGMVGLTWDIRKPAPHLLKSTEATAAAVEKMEIPKIAMPEPAK